MITRYNKNYMLLHLQKFIFSVLILCLGYSMEAQYSIKGYVYNEHAQPYSGANIMLGSDEGTVSDESGMFVFDNVRTDTYEIKVTAIGYKKEELQGSTNELDKEIYIMLTPSIEKIDEVTIVGDFYEQVKKTESLSIERVSTEELKATKASNLMQTLTNVPGVNSMAVGTGVSKPIIRGLGHYRVVVSQNGVKQEGQQWSNHQGISIDQHAVSGVEIIKGPASLQYGSDAIGGVINTLPSNVPNIKGLSGEISLVGKSNTKWMGASADLDFRSGDYYTTAALTYNNYGDFKIPQVDSFLLPSPVSAEEASHKVNLGNQLYNTSGREKAASIATGIIKPWGKSYIEVSYHGTKIGFFDWQGIKNDSIRALHEENDRDILLPLQKVDNFSTHHHTKRYFGDDNIEFSLGYQMNHTREYAPLSDRTGNRKDALRHYTALGNLELDLTLQTVSANAFYTTNRYKNQRIKFGFNSQFQSNTTKGYSHILPKYHRYGGGIFLTHRYTPSKKWVINSGARLDYTYLDIKKSINPDPDYGAPVFNQALQKLYPGTAFSLGFNYIPRKNTAFKLNIGKSFRVPSVYELGAYGLHRHGGRFEKGDINNKPEQAWQIDFSLDQKWENVYLQVSPFINYFTNYLYLTPTPRLLAQGQVFQYEQTKAALWGGEASVKYRFNKNIELQSGIEYVYAVNVDLQRALPFTPPMSAKTEISYSFDDNKRFSENKISLEMVNAAAQNYTVPNELNTPGYTSFNLTGTSDIHVGSQEIHLMLKVRNLFNSTYFNHTSFYRRLRIPEAGRDVQLFIGIPINKD